MNRHDMGCRVLAQREFSERDILDLADTFLTPGFHDIEVRSLSFARALVFQFVRSVSGFSSLACLSLSSDALSDNVISIYDDLYIASGGAPFSHELIDTYMLEHFFVDFCWIECGDLEGLDWYEHFRRRIIDFNLTKSVSFVAFHVA